jgi:hypothetical protein
VDTVEPGYYVRSNSNIEKLNPMSTFFKQWETFRKFSISIGFLGFHSERFNSSNSFQVSEMVE